MKALFALPSLLGFSTVNGVQGAQRTDGSLLDGRFSLFSNADAGDDVRLFTEDDTSGGTARAPRAGGPRVAPPRVI